jgi:hypothetical protein
MKNTTRKLTVITTLLAIFGIAINTNASVDQWIQDIEFAFDLRIENVETPSQSPFIQKGDFARIEAKVNENGDVIETQSLEHNNEDLAKAYEYALSQWKFESKGSPYKVIIPFVASH